MAQPLTVIVALTGSLTFFKGINQTFFGNGVMLGRQTPFQGGGGGIHVVRLNFKTSRVGVYKCLSLIVGFAVTVAIWPREVISCRDFILRTVATFWAISLVRIYPGRASRHSSHCTTRFCLWQMPHMTNISVAKATIISTISMFLTLYYKQTIGITEDV